MKAFRWLGSRNMHTCGKRAGLDVVLRHYGIEVREEARHTALADAEATARAVACMLIDYPRARSGEMSAS